MTDRKIIELLPSYLQNDQLRKFFNATVDHWFQPESSRKIAGFVGRIPTYHDPATDYYINEPTSERQAYQLEPTMKSVDTTTDDLLSTVAYPDLINHLRFQGANVDNHSRLFEQEFYSWAPPINVDMYLNFSNYYWYPQGPTLIEIRGNVSEPVDVDNDIIGKASYTSPNGITLVNGMHISFGTNVSPSDYLANDWIVEGVGRGIILVNKDLQDASITPLEYDDENKDYIVIGRGSKTENPWSRSNHWYHKDLITFEIATNTDEEAVLWDVDPWDSKPWDQILADISSDINLDTSLQAKRPIICFERDLELYNYGTKTPREADYLDVEHNDVFTQIQGQPSGSVVVDGNTLVDGDVILVAADINPLVNNRVYIVNVLEVSPSVFEYTLTIDTTGENLNGDPALGEKVLFLKGLNNKGKEYYFDGNNYVQSQNKLKRNQAPLFNLYDTDGTYLADESIYPDSTFIGNTIFEYKEDTSSSAIIDTELGFGIFYKNFSQISEIVFENTLQTKTYSYEVEPLIRNAIPQYYYYHIAESAGILDEYGNAWHLAPQKSSQDIKFGFYEIPSNLQANPDNDTVNEVSRSDLLNHFGSIINNQAGITGTLFTDTNYNQTSQDLGLGTEILQHRAPLLKTMMMTDKDDIDYMLSVRFSQKEYRRFYNKFLRKLDDFVQTGYTNNIPASQWLEDIMGLLNVSKQTSMFPFSTTRMIPHDENYIETIYNANPGDQDFIAPGIYNPEDITDDSVILVYIDNVLQTINYDYTINGNTVELTDPLSTSAVVELRFYATVEKSYIPATPSAMGIESVFKPEIFIDTTYTDPRWVIQGHDGSLTLAYGDDRDAVILEYETRVYNTIRQKFQLEKNIVLDNAEIFPGKFRTNGYVLEEYFQILTPIFTTWATKSNIKWADNTTYSGGNWKTWNWTGTFDTLDGEPLRGNWRSIYNYYYDTDRPHTHPWEMVGFSEEPSWWSTEYGSAPYTNLNTKMWTDLSEGKIISGSRAGTYDNYKRDRLLSLIPVDDGGELLSPVEIGITLNNPTVEQAGADWTPGDMSPAETVMWRSPEGKFILSQIAYLMKPAAYVEANWDTEGIDFSSIAPEQLINTRYGYRPHSSELFVTTETDTDNNEIKIQGIQQWIADYLQSTNLSIADNLGNVLRGLNVSLGWRMSTFAKVSTLRFLADSFSPGSTASAQKVFIQDDDLNVELYKSASTKEPIYSGVLIEWTGTGYAVYGYDSVYPFFRTIPNVTNGKTINVSVGNVTVTETKQGTDQIVEVPYGYEFTSRQDLYDFLTEYGRWLENEGWVFDQYDNTTNEILNWRYSGKEFLFWSLDDLSEGAFITLSPLANQVKFKQTTGFIENVEEVIRGAYTVLDRQGQPINPRDIETFREDSEFIATPSNEQGIFALRLSVTTYEHIVLVNNVTRFNDTIYIPLFNLRQARLKAFGTVIDGWNGRIETPGYILDLVTNNDLIPNFEKTADDFLRYHDIENPSENETITDSARHLIGYQRREYLDQLLVDRDVQYEFYQGMIHQKGSRNSLNKLFRSTAITTSTDVQFFEEWAFRIGQYGGLEIMPPLEFYLSSEEVKIDPQLIRFVSGDTPDISTDNVIDIVPNDERWIMKSTVDEPEFVLREKNKFYKKDLPNAGFAQLGETDYLAASADLLFDESHSVYSASVNETVWVARNENTILNKDWDILKLLAYDNDIVWYSSSVDNNILDSYKRDVYVGDGTTQNFASTSTLPLDQDTTYVLINGNPVDYEDYTILGTNTIGFTTAPESGDSIVIDAASTHTWTEIDINAYFDDTENKIGGTISDVDAISITIDESFIIETGVQAAFMTYWESRRYVNSSGLLPTEFEDQIIYLDGDSANDGWVVLRSDGITFKEIRREENLVDTKQIKNGIIYDDRINRIKANMTTYDPFKGDIPGIADVEITYKLEYDPAKYTHNLDEDAFDEDLAWSQNQIGQVWWDTSKATYLWYEQGDIEYRYQNWGNLFPGSQIKVYEWVRSPVPPTEWNAYITSNLDEFNFSNSGTVKDIDTIDGPRWVQRSEINNRTREVSVYYYFWVENSNSTPNLDFRSIPLTEITTILTDPFSYGLKYCAAIRSDVFIVANITSNLNEVDTALQINFNPTDTEVPIHRQWELLREGDNFSDIKDVHWNKMRDSLVGFDDLGKEIPDNRLRGRTRFGHFIRPRQTWFEDINLARQVFVEAVNNVLIDIDVVSSISNYDNYLNTEATLNVPVTTVTGTIANPSVTSGSQININGEIIVLSGLGSIQNLADELNTGLSTSTTFAEITYNGTDAYINIKDTFGRNINIIDVVGTPAIEIGLAIGVTSGEGPDEIVATRVERDLLVGLSTGDRVYVESDENVQGYWTFWELEGDGSWKLLQIQSYKTNLYWNFVDWYLEGYSSATEIDIVFGTLTDRNNADTTNGTIAKVEDDGSGKWLLSIKENNQWTTIGKEDATIQFSKNLYDVKSGEYGFDDDLFDTKPFDDVPNVEFRQIMNALRENILVGTLLLQQNIIFFKMVRHVHTEQELVDWCFKTSYIYLIGFSEALEQKPLFTYDGFESLIDYVKEVKPYHTKIKDVVRTFASTADESSWIVTDFDKPPYDDPNDSSTITRILDPESADDSVILSTETPWVYWWNEYEKDDRPILPRANNVRKLTTKIVFDRTSAIRDDYVPTMTFPEYPDIYAQLPFFESALMTNSTAAQDNPEWVLLNAYDGTSAPTNNRATLRLKPVNKLVTINATGTWTNNSIIVIKGNTESDFTGDSVTLATIDDAGTFTFNSTAAEGYPFIEADFTAFQSGDMVTVKMTATYDNALSRAIRDYKPTSDMVQLLELITSEYQGVILDGFGSSITEGFDNGGWDSTGWDSTLVTLNSSDEITVSGGAFFTYVGDDTTDTYSLPPTDMGSAPWRVYVSDITVNPRTPYILEENTHYTINSGANTITMINTGDSWNGTGAFLETDWALVILDSSYASEQPENIILDGYNLTQSDVEGWPEELTPLKINESLQVTVETSGNIIQNLLENATSVQDGAPVTFVNQTPIVFTFSGISGDTVVLEGSNTGAFAGEETVIETIVANGSITVPDIGSGYMPFTYYRARVTVYGSGTINVVAQIDVAPSASRVTHIGDGLKTVYEIENNVTATDDLLVTVDGVLTEAYTVQLVADTITFAIAPALSAKIQITSWNTTGIANTDPTWATATYAGAPMDLTSFGGVDVKPDPTQPLEGSIIAFVDTGTGYRRLTPPEMSYYQADGNQETFIPVLGSGGSTSGNLTVYLNNQVQTITTHYTFDQGGQSNPQIDVNADGSGYTIGDTLTLSGGSGTSTVFDVIEVAPIDAQDETNYNGAGSNGSFTAGSGYAASDTIILDDGTTITVDAVTSGNVTQFTVDNSTINYGQSANGATIAQSTTSGSGEGFSITLNDNNEGCFAFSTTTAGLYTALPTSPNSPTGGTGSGLTVNLSVYEIIEDKVNFVTTPTADSIVSFRTLGNEEYFITGDDIDFTSGVSATDDVGIMAFKDDDQPIGIQTVSWPGNPNVDDVETPEYAYTIFNNPVGTDYVFATVDTGSGGLDILEVDYSIEFGSGWDQDSWDNEILGYDDGPGGTIKLNTSYIDSDRVVLTTFSGNPTFSPVVYREFTGYDTKPDDFTEFVRFSDKMKTTITSNIVPTATSITVADGSIFPEFGGVAWIGHERIEYGVRSGNVLSELVRGSKGTRKNKTHGSGATIRPGDDTQIVHDMKDNMANDSGTRLQGSKTEQAIFINKETGSYF